MDKIPPSCGKNDCKTEEQVRHSIVATVIDATKMSAGEYGLLAVARALPTQERT
jgi:hypothetical protein